MTDSYTLWDTAPSNEIFDDIKAQAIKLWGTYDNTYGYVDEKLGLIVPLPNVGSNYMTIVQMFDHSNQVKLFEALQPATRIRVLAAML